ncbi:type I phosphomannose isomerase catalytic subunit [Opitutus terrae]|uniref:Mannose-6-phosphate isomerase type I n=1 Tax=Opitutus terrae (strain DSM 11246 / JCM 15787 / PB90-1) TaxID=452637 RepID=B1ZUR8_OPITP|nr:type I phosphomannose isomerase catalytic subunit [Opitutus terrae]ACB74952.1 mannose-6-phosphate isomerase type I [Opitutus terrae PB90-1]
MRDVLRFEPIYQDRVWGGRVLESTFGRTLPAERPIGESWEIVDRPEAQSIVKFGTHKGSTLRQLIEARAADIMGPKWPADRRFPLLVKWLDCRERLSLQVHPPAAAAAELGGEPKTENWYIAHSSADAKLLVGLQRGVTREQFERAIADNTLEQCIHQFRVAAGDSILVHSGQVHAIDAGNLILEIQQNSDTTYRVYDWGRVGLDGKPRQLHIDQSLRSILWDDFEPAPVRGAPTSGVIASCAEFTIRRLVLGTGERFSVHAEEQPRVLSVVSGSVRIGNENTSASRAPFGQVLACGENVLLPYAGAFTFSAASTSILLLTEDFCG